MIFKKAKWRGYEDTQKVQELGTYELSEEVDSGGQTLLIHLGTKKVPEANRIAKGILAAITKGEGL